MTGDDSGGSNPDTASDGPDLDTASDEPGIDSLHPDGGESIAEAANGEASAVPPSDPGLARWLHVAMRALQLSLVGLAAYTVVGPVDASALNVLLPFAVALVPDAIHRWTGWRMNPVLSLWIVLAAVLHATGSLGAYTAVPVYDQVAHGVSAALAAGVGYALVRAVDEAREDVVLPANLRFVFIFVFAMAVGAVWEVAEFALGRAAEVLGGEPLLTQYGLEDTIWDLVFDAAGAVLVAAFGTRYFDGIRAAIATRVGEDGRAGSE